MVFRHRRAAHVTLRFASHVVNLRSPITRQLLQHILLSANGRFGTRIVQLAILSVDRYSSWGDFSTVVPVSLYLIDKALASPS